ncbi:MAG: QcrA and Rieske domain-containing protein [Symbiobacteriia bacterium]
MSDAETKGPGQVKKDEGVNRRRFLSLGVWTIGGLGAAGYLTAALRFLYPPPAKAAEVQKVGMPEDFPVGVPKMVAYSGAGVSNGVYILHGTGRWDAYDVHCTHLQCPVNYYAATGTYLCPCHGSVFDINGNNLSGPAPSPLRRHQIEVRSDGVYVGGLIT